MCGLVGTKGARRHLRRLGGTCNQALGLHIQADGKSNVALQRLTKTTDQVIHMIRRVANRQGGLKETDSLRLVQAFVLSRITCIIPCLILSKKDGDKINTLIRKATKHALSIPMSTSTNRLLRMGLHNTLDELVEGHLSSQKSRPAKAQAGRKVLEKIKWASTLQIKD